MALRLLPKEFYNLILQEKRKFVYAKFYYKKIELWFRNSDDVLVFTKIFDVNDFLELYEEMRGTIEIIGVKYAETE